VYTSVYSPFKTDIPPTQLHEVVKGILDSGADGGLFPVLTLLEIDIKALIADQPSLLQSQTEAFKTYNEEQFTTVKLPGGSQEVSTQTQQHLAQQLNSP